MVGGGMLASTKTKSTLLIVLIYLPDISTSTLCWHRRRAFLTKCLGDDNRDNKETFHDESVRSCVICLFGFWS